MGEYGEPIAVERQIKGGDAFLRVTRVPEFREAGLLLGDAVTNFRAALDHLTWDLVKLGSHGRLAPKEALQIQFPLANSAAGFRVPEHRRRRMPGITDEQWRIVGQYQPYQRGDRGRAMRLLRQISDTDKHRFIAPAVACATGYVGRVQIIGCTVHNVRRFPPNRALHVGAKLISMSITPISTEYDVKIESQITVNPSLGYGVPLGPAVFGIRETVKEILSRFEAML